MKASPDIFVHFTADELDELVDLLEAHGRGLPATKHQLLRWQVRLAHAAQRARAGVS